jgi:hypothetical protein
VALVFEDVLAPPAAGDLRFEVAAGCDTIRIHEGVGFLAKSLTDLVRRPDEELALLALAASVPAAKRSGIGILGRIESSVKIEHFAHHVVQNLLGDGLEELVAGHLPGVETNAGEPRVVIKYLLKVGCTVQYVWFGAGSPLGALSADLVAPDGKACRGLAGRARSATMLNEGVEQLLPQGGGEK